MNRIYFEKKTRKLIPFALIQCVLLMGFKIPILDNSLAAKWGLILALVLTLIFELKIVFVRRPVLIITENTIFLRGVTPGFFKLFQRWHAEEIRFADIITIEIGRIRRKLLGRISIPPLGEPSRNAVFQDFLWITYLKAGSRKELYYPHTPEIKDFDDALQELMKIGGYKVILHPPHKGPVKNGTGVRRERST